MSLAHKGLSGTCRINRVLEYARQHITLGYCHGLHAKQHLVWMVFLCYASIWSIIWCFDVLNRGRPASSLLEGPFLPHHNVVHSLVDPFVQYYRQLLRFEQINACTMISRSTDSNQHSDKRFGGEDWGWSSEDMLLDWEGEGDST